jgi:hypothetical protein
MYSTKQNFVSVYLKLSVFSAVRQVTDAVSKTFNKNDLLKQNI